MTGRSKLKQRSREDRQEGVTSSSKEHDRRQPHNKNGRMTSSDMRRLSPPTPIVCDIPTASPYFSKPVSSYDGLPDDGLNFGNVSGLYLDESPIFCTDENSPFTDLPTHTWSNYHY